MEAHGGPHLIVRCRTLLESFSLSLSTLGELDLSLSRRLLFLSGARAVEALDGRLVALVLRTLQVL